MVDKNNYNDQISNMMNRLNVQIKKAGGLNKFISNLRNSREERQRRVMNILRYRGMLTPSTSRMLNGTPVEVNAYIKGQRNNENFVNVDNALDKHNYSQMSIYSEAEWQSHAWYYLFYWLANDIDPIVIT